MFPISNCLQYVIPMIKSKAFAERSLGNNPVIKIWKYIFQKKNSRGDKMIIVKSCDENIDHFEILKQTWNK